MLYRSYTQCLDWLFQTSYTAKVQNCQGRGSNAVLSIINELFNGGHGKERVHWANVLRNRLSKVRWRSGTARGSARVDAIVRTISVQIHETLHLCCVHQLASYVVLLKYGDQTCRHCYEYRILFDYFLENRKGP